jgi:hypothetical protein
MKEESNGMRLLWIILIGILVSGTPCMAENSVKEAGKEVGHGFKKFGKDTGQAFKEGGKEVGQGFKNLGKETGQAFKQGGKEIGPAAKKSGRSMGDWFRDVGHSFKRFFNGA